MITNPNKMIQLSMMMVTFGIGILLAVNLIVGLDTINESAFATIPSLIAITAAVVTIIGMCIFTGYGLVFVVLFVLRHCGIRVGTSKTPGWIGCGLSAVVLALILCESMLH